MAIPYLVVRLEEVERLEDARIVDQDIDMRNLGDESATPFSGRDIGCDGGYASPGTFAFQAFGGLCGLSSERPLITTSAPALASWRAIA
jgi:hypothetical protein